MNSAGEMQASALGERLSDVRFDAAYASPLGRAHHTARIVLGNAQTRVVTDAALSELSYGEWQGLMHAEWPDGNAARWANTPWDVAFPDGETLLQVRARAVPALRRIVANHAGETVLIAAHGHVNRVLLLDALRKPEHGFWSIAQSNCEAWKLVYRVNADGSAHLLDCREVPQVSRAVAQRAIDAKTKPAGALGLLEDCAVRLAVLQQTLFPQMERTRICVFAADHGVADEGVSAYPRAVTAEMMKNFSRGGAAINVLCRTHDTSMDVIDVGVDADLSLLPGVRHAKVRRGSGNLAREAAMSAEELQAAMAAGADAVKRALAEGVQAIGLGEMGIGNTTAAAALLSALTGQDASVTVGRGTGVSSATLAHKEQVVAGALLLHGMRPELSARECLRCLGGLELAAIAGAVLEASHHSVAIVVDGFISTVSVLCAALIAFEEELPNAHGLGDRLFLAHHSQERGHTLAIEALGAALGQAQRPLLNLEMRLGEGTGAALAMPLLRSAAAIMREMATFASAGVSGGAQGEHPV